MSVFTRQFCFQKYTFSLSKTLSMAQKPVLVIGNLVLVRRRTLHHAGLDKKPPRCQAVVLRRHSELSLARHQPTLRSILRRPCDAEPHQGTFESTDLWICEQTDSPAHVHPIFSCPSSGRGGWDHINCMGSAAPRPCPTGSMQPCPCPWGALSVGLIHPLLCNITSLPWFLHASKVPRLQQHWDRERKKRLKGKKVLFQVKEFHLMHCII